MFALHDLPHTAPAEPLAAYFAQQRPDAVPPDLLALQRAGDLLRAFSALFAPSESAAMVRLWMLRTLAARAGDPRWTTQEIDARFGDLDPAKRNTVLSRLKEHGLMVWDGSSQTWQVSTTGRMVLAALGHLLDIPEGMDADLAYITAELVGAESQGRVNHEVLHLLLGKYQDLQRDLEDAVTSGSERLLREARNRLDAVQGAVSRGTEVIHRLARRDDLEAQGHREAQAIGQAQSRILRMSSVFDRELAKHDRNRVLMGSTGLSTRDIGDWLHLQNPSALSALLTGGLAVLPELAAMDCETLVDLAEHELGRSRTEDIDPYALPGAQSAQGLAPEQEDFTELERFTARLANIAAPTDVLDVLDAEDFALAAYQLTLLSLPGSPVSSGMQPAVTKLLTTPLRLALDATHREGRGSIAALNAGQLIPTA